MSYCKPSTHLLTLSYQLCRHNFLPKKSVKKILKKQHKCTCICTFFKKKKYRVEKMKTMNSVKKNTSKPRILCF